MSGIDISTRESDMANSWWAAHLKFAVAVKACSSEHFLLQRPNTAEVATTQQAVSDLIRDEGMCPPKVDCPLIIKTRIGPGIAYTEEHALYKVVDTDA